MAKFSSYLIPGIIFFIIAYGFYKRINVYDAFTAGVKEGVGSVAAIFPSLFALFVAVNVFRASGLVEYVSKILSPLCSLLHFPKDLVPFALLRPISGSGSLALASDIYSNLGPDSFEGRLASVMMGSTETTFYTIAVYFGACGTKNIRHSLKCALLADVFSMILSTILCTAFFS